YGNIATAYTGKVHFVSSDVAAVLPADYVFTAADAGVHTFRVTLKTAGTSSVTATDAVNSSITGQQSGITVTPPAASSFSLSAPPSASAGTSFIITLTVKDASGNIATGYTGKVHFTSSDAAAALPADYVFTAADAG